MKIRRAQHAPTTGLILLALAHPLPASVSLETARFSPDITMSVQGQIVHDEQVGADELGGGASLVDIGDIPENADITAYHLLENGHQLFALDITVALPGGISMSPRDVIRFSGSGYSREFAGADFGIPAGAHVDALTMKADGGLLMSFDVSVSLDGIVFNDEDLASFDGANFSMFFDGSEAGIDPALDLDAAHFLADDEVLIVSFDGAGMASATTFRDEDLLQYDTVTLAWGMAYDGSARHAGWSPADLDAAYVTVDGQLIFKDGFESF